MQVLDLGKLEKLARGTADITYSRDIEESESSEFRLLDLYCCGGGASMGYWLAGFDVVGVDVRNQPRYPFSFVQRDALAALQDREFMSQFHAVHASPPCQLHTQLKYLRAARGLVHTDRDWIAETRHWLDEWGGLYIIENVPNAPIRNNATLCGTQFGLQWGGKQLQRHRWFEANFRISRPGCRHSGKPPWGIYGSLREEIPGGSETPPTLDAARKLMGISWLLWRELKEAIPPAFTHHLGLQLASKLRELEACTNTRPQSSRSPMVIHSIF